MSHKTYNYWLAVIVQYKMNIWQEYMFRYEYVLEGIKTDSLQNLAFCQSVWEWAQGLFFFLLDAAIGKLVASYVWHNPLDCLPSLRSSSRKLDLGLKIALAVQKNKYYFIQGSF